LWNEEKYAEGEPVFAMQSKHLNPPNLQRMATGQEKGFVIIEKFQSLKGLEINVLNTSEKRDGFQFEVSLNNTNTHAIQIVHISNPVLAVMQNRDEIVSVSLSSSISKQKIEPGEEVTIHLSVPQEKINIKFPVTVYTRTKENIRGEITSLKLN
jgi:hypothetical protein